MGKELYLILLFHLGLHIAFSENTNSSDSTDNNEKLELENFRPFTTTNKIFGSSEITSEGKKFNKRRTNLNESDDINMGFVENPEKNLDYNSRRKNIFNLNDFENKAQMQNTRIINFEDRRQEQYNVENEKSLTSFDTRVDNTLNNERTTSNKMFMGQTNTKVTPEWRPEFFEQTQMKEDRKLNQYSNSYINDPFPGTPETQFQINEEKNLNQYSNSYLNNPLLAKTDKQQHMNEDRKINQYSNSYLKDPFISALDKQYQLREDGNFNQYLNDPHPATLDRRLSTIVTDHQEIKKQKKYNSENNLLNNMHSKYPNYSELNYNGFQKPGFYNADRGVVINFNSDCPRQKNNQMVHRFIIAQKYPLREHSEISSFQIPSSTYITSSQTTPLYYF